MIEALKSSFNQVLKFSESELNAIINEFSEKKIEKKEFLLKEAQVCDFVGFIIEGTMRHYHIHNGVEKTCFISFENEWISDMPSFSTETKSGKNFQALQASTLLIIKRKNLYELYEKYPKLESFVRIMVERLANMAIKTAMSLASLTPEERYTDLLKQRPDIFQRVPQKYIANILGVQPESLSRIRKRVYSKS